MTEKSAAERAVEILARELPGFEATAYAPTNEIRVRGLLKLGAGVSAEALEHYAMLIPDRGVEEYLSKLIAETRRLGIEALGLAREIEARTEAAESRGRREGHAAGLAQGRREGRAELLREIAEALEGIRS